ncbi:TPA: LepB GTPase-activating domain-containing protein [Legionella anisa]|nr:LepB GTPase-activating domain-containing protein [Legionella anisa]
MTQLLLACLACGDFGIHPYLSKSSELQAPSDQLSIVDYISHASRVILDYQGLSEANKKELLTLFPVPGGDNKIFSRSATHNVCRGGEGEVVEGKGFLLGVIGQLPEMIKLALDFGINIAMGGEGQENFYGKKISANGYSGHFYFHRNDKDNLLMLGLEQSAPAASPLAFIWGTEKYSEDVQQNHDQFGQGHSLTGASDTYTAAGSLYFSDPIYQAKLLSEKGVFPPDKYGAMQVKLTDANWPEIKKFLEHLRSLSDEKHKEQLLDILLTKPSTAKPTKGDYKSYIALDFQSYLKRVYQVFISEEELDAESQLNFFTLQSNLLATIKKLQQGQIENYELFKQQIEAIIGIKNIPPEYRKAIIRIQHLFELQLEIDPGLNQTHQDLLLRNQYDDLQEESKVILEKLLQIQKHFQEHPPKEVSKELQDFLLQLDMQIVELENPFASKEPIDLESSWFMCESPVLINTDSIEKLRQTIERAKTLTKQSPLKGVEGVSFPQVLSSWQEKLLPLSQINLIDYTELNLNDLAKQFNEYLDLIAQQAEALNLWEHDSSQTTNLLVNYSDKKPKLYDGYAFVAQYRESTILRNLLSLDPSNLSTLRFMPYEAPAALCTKELPESYWSKVTALLTAGSDVIASLRTLKNLQTSKASWEDMSRTATSLKEAIARFEKAREEVAKHPRIISEEAPRVVFESPFFYPISDEALKTMNGVQLATICLEELNAKTPSILVKRITSNQELWQSMNVALETEIDDFKRRKENVEQKITVLRQIRSFWELLNQFKESAILQTKETHLLELKRLSQECPSIFGAEEAIKEAQAEFTNLQQFLSLLQDFAEAENKYLELQTLEKQYLKLPENEKAQYLSRLNESRESVFQLYLEKINASKTIDEWKENFCIFDQLFKKLPVDVQGKLHAYHETKLKEYSVYGLLPLLGKTTVQEKKDIFDGEVFSSIIKNFENLNDALTSGCTKRVHKHLTRTKVIYEELLGAGVIKPESPSQSVDTLLNQLEPILDAIKDSLHGQLVKTALQDEMFKDAILKKARTHKKFTSELIQDLFALKEFRDQKIALSEQKKYGSEYDQSINDFYEKTLDIRLSDHPLKKQGEEIINAANVEFKHRHDGVRLLADIVMMVSVLGLLVGVGRLAAHKSFFFSSYLSDIKTDREVELKDNWLVKDLPEDESDARLIAAPAA